MQPAAYEDGIVMVIGWGVEFAGAAVAEPPCFEEDGAMREAVRRADLVLENAILPFERRARKRA